MKQARRKELKTNELSIYLQQIQEAVVRNSNYIIGGIVVVVLILMIGLYVRSSRHQAEAARWNELEELQRQAATELKPETIERAQRLANDTTGDKLVGPKARELHADLVYQQAMDLSPVSKPDEYAGLLNEAKQSYQAMINTYADLPTVVARGRLGLASTLESLHAVDKAQVDEVRKQYEQIIESGKANKALAPYVETALMRMETLTERTRPLQIVATLPAEPVETAPAPAESGTTQPEAEAATTAPQ